MNLNPQLTKLVKEAPIGNEWLHEVKFDGYRLICVIKDSNIKCFTRNQHDWSKKLKFLTDEIKKLNLKQAIIDGELVAIDRNGKSNFQLLQNTIHTDQKNTKYVYYVFDLISFNHKNIRELPLIDRKNLLKKILTKKSKIIKLSDHIIGNGEKVFQSACKHGLEGIISKKIQSCYEHKRSSSWVKVKCIKRQEFIICGYTSPQNNRKHFGSLLLGVYNTNKQLQYCGNVGTGFSNKTLKEMDLKLKKLHTKKPQFISYPKKMIGVFWVKPKLVAEVEFTEWTKDGNLRHPSFKGLREDKKPKEIKREY